MRFLALVFLALAALSLATALQSLALGVRERARDFFKSALLFALLGLIGLWLAGRG